MKNKVLIVDDNTNNLSVLGNLLLNKGIAVQVAENGQTAIQMVRKKQPDLILLDINMPGISGYEVCKTLKEDQTTANIPIIFLTAYSETENIVEGFHLGAVDYVTKPFKTDELLSRVKTHLELKNAKTELEQKNIELQKSNATKDKLFSIIAHDLRSPIGSMLSFLNFVSEEGVSAVGSIERFIHLQKDLTRNTYNLLENLLNWAKNNLNQIQVEASFIRLNEIIENCLQLIQPAADKKNIQLKFQPCLNDRVYADHNLVKLILRNLLDNAIKFTPEKGFVDIKIVETGNFTTVSISDSGRGIEKENIEKILSENEFYTSSGTNYEKGSGLGLKLVKNAVELNGGSFNIVSELKHGSCFSFSLPKDNKQ